MNQKRVGIIGAGPAGLMAAGRAAGRGHQVTVFEKNNRAGRKLMITGKGRCNITNACPEDELMRNIPGNGRFLYSSLNRFSNQDIMTFFKDCGLRLKTERGNRVFPESDRALDICEALIDYAVKNGAVIKYHSCVREILAQEGKITGLVLDNGDFHALDAVVIATGGLSYPLTGSTGEGHKMAQELGHTVTELKPSLVPLETEETWVREVRGLTLKNIGLTVYDANHKKVFSEQGEMLFTHFGVSGPLILSASRHILACGFKGSRLSIDMKPALSEATLDKRIQRDFDKFSRKQLVNALHELLPKSMIPVFIGLLDIPPEKPVNQMTRQDRQKMVALLKDIRLTVSRSRPIAEAIVTAGGIRINEIDPGTMASKMIKGLYFSGEIIDVDAYTGGYNLTIALSTGFTVGNSI